MELAEIVLRDKKAELDSREEAEAQKQAMLDQLAHQNQINAELAHK